MCCEVAACIMIISVIHGILLCTESKQGQETEALLSCFFSGGAQKKFVILCFPIQYYVQCSIAYVLVVCVYRSDDK